MERTYRIGYHLNIVSPRLFDYVKTITEITMFRYTIFKTEIIDEKLFLRHVIRTNSKYEIYTYLDLIGLRIDFCSKEKINVKIPNSKEIIRGVGFSLIENDKCI